MLGTKINKMISDEDDNFDPYEFQQSQQKLQQADVKPTVTKKPVRPQQVVKRAPRPTAKTAP